MTLRNGFLIIFGILIIYISIEAGLSLIDDSMDNSIKDELVSHCTKIASYAQQFYFKPAEMGGGDNTFNTCGGHGKGFTIAPAMSLSKNGTYAGWANAHTYYITATPIIVNGKKYSFSQITCSVTPSSITFVIE